MKKSNLPISLTTSYLLLAAVSIIYELAIRIYDRGNSEFAGMMSVALTLPTSVGVIWILNYIFGMNPGDSDIIFVLMLGLTASVNAGLLFLIVKRLARITLN